jgi:ABC-type dipeptide/oligopeptide/nickel transport system permease subunit
VKRAFVDPRARVGLAVFIAICGACALVPEVFALDPHATDLANRHAEPSLSRWMGTDALGRDLMARVLVGGRTSLLVGVAASFVSVLIGTLYGAFAGTRGGALDEAMMRIVDFLYGLPYMFLVILITMLFSDTARGEALPVFVALGLVQWLTTARIVRGEALSLAQRDFVAAARALGASEMRVLFVHIIPNLMGTVLVYAALTVPSVILLESFLSFLGLGVALSWGELVAEGVSVVNPIASRWWLLAFPSAFLAATLLSLNLLGDAMRDALDPKR